MKSIMPLLFLGVLAGACLVGAAGKLPAFTVERWVNSVPLTAEALRGKVVLLDGQPVGEARGADVGDDGVARFDRSGMLRLVAGASRRRHVLTLVAADPGVRAFVFTFGP
jgi:hypothetical protein